MNFWSWLFNAKGVTKTVDEYEKEIAELKDQLLKLEKELIHWKYHALNFRKFHQ